MRHACISKAKRIVIKVGSAVVTKETGRLDQMFARMAEIYESDTRTAIKRFTALFEPLVILVMGILVGVLILSMLLAITSINEVAL